MLKSLGLTTALTVSLATAAFAQSSSTTVTPATPPASSSSTVATGAGTTTHTGPVIESKQLIGRHIVNADNKTIGDVESVILDPQGQVKSVIVGVGGFLGIGQKPVAVDWNQLQIQNNGQRVVMNTTADQLKTMPEYQYPSDQRRGNVYTMRDNSGALSGGSGTNPAGAYGTGSGTSRMVPGPNGPTTAPAKP